MRRGLWFLLILLILALAVNVWLIWRGRAKPHRGAAKLAQRPASFVWGIGLYPWPTVTANHTPQLAARVLKTARDLGVSHVRIDVPPWAEDPIALLREPLREARRLKLNVLLSFTPRKPPWELENPYRAGYDEGFMLARAFRREVFLFQLGNEAGAWSIKPNWPGNNRDSYDETRYKITREWIRGASEGVRAGNRQARRLVAGNWLQTTFIERLLEDGIEFELIGWDWFNEEHDITKVLDAGKPFDLVGKLASFGKELWLLEGGRSGGPTIEDDRKQAETAERLARQFRELPAFQGFFVFQLYDQIHLIGKGRHEFDGIVRIRKLADGSFELGDPKPAYHAYRRVIQEYARR